MYIRWMKQHLLIQHTETEYSVNIIKCLVESTREVKREGKKENPKRLSCNYNDEIKKKAKVVRE